MTHDGTDPGGLYVALGQGYWVPNAAPEAHVCRSALVPKNRHRSDTGDTENRPLASQLHDVSATRHIENGISNVL
jgi:hypothetical protein